MVAFWFIKAGAFDFLRPRTYIVHPDAFDALFPLKRHGEGRYARGIDLLNAAPSIHDALVWQERL